MDIAGVVAISLLLSFALWFFSNSTRRPRWFPYKIYTPVWHVVAVYWKIPSLKELILYNRFMRQWRWDKRTDKEAMPIQRWSYNGFSGQLKKGLTSFTGKFIAWTNDPGVAIIKCSDGEDRRIPSYAIPGHMPPQPNYEKMKKQGKMYYFGHASGSEN